MQFHYRHRLVSSVVKAATVLTKSKSFTLGLCLTLGGLAHAQTPIDVWHAMPSYQANMFEKIVQHFNESQKEVKVQLQVFGSQAELESAASKAYAEKKAPHLVGLSTEYSQNLLAKNAFTPIGSLFSSADAKNLDWFLPSSLRILRDSSGKNLMALPWMTETPLLFYNRDQFTKAGVTLSAENNKWDLWAGSLDKLYISGSRCPLTTTHWTPIHLEAVAATHDEPYVKGNSQVNGQSITVNKVFFVHHISLLKTWKIGGLLVKFATAQQAKDAFLQQQCAVITAGSTLWGALQAQNTFQYGMMPLPVYSGEKSKGNNPFVWGSGLWAIKNTDRAQSSAVSYFLSYLVQPKLAGEWAAYTGYLPITQSARTVAKQLVYDKVPDGATIVANFAKAPLEFSKGFSIRNYPQVLQILEKKIDLVMDQDKAAFGSLNEAVLEIEKLNRAK